MAWLKDCRWVRFGTGGFVAALFNIRNCFNKAKQQEKINKMMFKGLSGEIYFLTEVVWLIRRPSERIAEEERTDLVLDVKMPVKRSAKVLLMMRGCVSKTRWNIEEASVSLDDLQRSQTDEVCAHESAAGLFHLSHVWRRCFRIIN